MKATQIQRIPNTKVYEFY